MLAPADEMLLAPLEQLGFPLAWRASDETASYALRHDAEGGRTIEIETVGDGWTVAQLEGWALEALGSCELIHAGALSAADFPSEALALLARDRRLSLDGQALVRPARRGPLRLEAPSSLDQLEHVDVLKLSLEEAEVLGVGPSPRTLATLSVAEVVLSASTRGVWVYAEGALSHVQCEVVPTRDTTGAGDALIACYLCARLDGTPATEAARRAADAVSAMLRRRLEAA